MNYRKLTDNEIKILEFNGCRADDWTKIEVRENFRPEKCRNVRFSGEVRLGVFEKDVVDSSGVTITSGIENAQIHNCIIGDNISIYNVHDYIANYIIDNESVIRNCGKIHTEGSTSFGNGTEVAVMNETGGRSVRIWDRLSSHLAYIFALYRHRQKVAGRIEDMINRYAERQVSDRGYIGKNCRIVNCVCLRNVRIGSFARLESVLSLNEGSVNSTPEDPVFIGPGVIMEHFIINSGSEVTESTVVEKCYIGQGCVLGKQFSAHNSLFFANSQGFHGEVYSVFGGPYTVTHHKSTLLIAGIFSFMNAGSGSNQSNHMYKLGPVHQGVVERGTKTASDSYILWPARIGPYSLVTGRHLKNIDTSLFPFSYVVENNRETILLPAINLISTGTIRDQMKWASRDKRKDPAIIDYLNFRYLTPFTVNRMIKGREMLIILKENCLKEKDNEFCCYNKNLKISLTALERGIELYTMGIDKYVGDGLIKKLYGKSFKTDEELRNILSVEADGGRGEWVDLAGLITPRTKVEELLKEIESGDIKSLEEIALRFRFFSENYEKWEWDWISGYLERETGKPAESFSAADIIPVIERWIKSINCLNEKLFDDAGKEFSVSSMTGFGIDWDEEDKLADYRQVRGIYDMNPVVETIRREVKEKSAIADEIIKMLESIRN